MAGEEDNKDGKALVTQVKDPKPVEMTAEVSLEEAVGEVDAFEEEKKETPEMEALRAHIDAVREEIAVAERLFVAAKKQIDAHIALFPDPALQTEEQRGLELALFSPDKNTLIKELFEKVKTIDLGLNGKIGELTKKVYPNAEGSTKSSKEYTELVSICEHDLGACVRFLKMHEMMYANKMRTYQAEQAKQGSGDLGPIRRHFEGFESAWEQGKLLEEDLLTRLPSKDAIEAKDTKIATLTHVFGVFKKGIEDQKRNSAYVGSKEIKLHMDEAVEQVSVQMNEGAMYFILRNIAYNPIRKSYIDADKISIRVEGNEPSQQVVIEIEDNGKGVSPEKRQKIFEPGETGAGNSGDGVGMGLAHSDIRLASMGMEVTVASARKKSLEEDDKNYGSTFTIRIPIVAKAT